MANCNTQQLNITCGTDVVLHDRLIFDGETFDPNLSVGIAANLVSSLGKRRALDVQVVDDELLISVPWVDGTLPGCYGLEVTGSCNSKKWSTYADSLIRYTKATRPGASEVTVESDSYDITQEVAYCYSNSPVTFAEVTVDDGYGTPSVDVEYEQRVLSMDFHNLKGNGITDIDVDEQVGDEAVNTVTIKTDANQEGTEFKVRNGSRGNGIASSSEQLSDQDGGINTFTITDDDGTVHEFHSKNGTKGGQGDSAVYDPSSPDAPDFVMANGTGQSTTKAMTQKAVTDELLDAEAGEYKSVTLSRLKQYRNYISGGVWKTASNDNNLCSFLPVNPGQIIKTYTELTSHHVIFLASGEPGASDSTPAYAGGVTEMPGWNNSPGSVFYYKVPNDATYLYIRLKDGGNVKTPTVWVAEVLPETTKRLDKAEEDILDARAYSFKEQNLSNLDLEKKYISGNAWASGSENNCCVFLPVTAGNIMRTKSVDSTHHVIFLTTGTSGSVGALPDYAGGLICQPEYNSAGVWHYYVVPSDATHLYVRTKISGVDRTPLIEVAQTVNDTISDVKDNLGTLLSSLIKTEVDTSNLTVYNSYISGDGVWVGGSAANNNCIFVPVEPGRKYFVGRDDGLQWHAFFLKNDSIVNAAAPAYAGGITTKPEWFNGMKIMTAPADARFLYVRRRYAGSTRTPNVYHIQDGADEEERFLVAQAHDGSATVGLLHFSDLHGDANAVKLLIQKMDNYSDYINNAICTGDVVHWYAEGTSSYPEGYDWWKETGLAEKSLFVLGNHDGATTASTEYDDKDGTAAWDGKGREWAFDTYFADYISGLGCAMPAGYGDSESQYYKACYWHKDFADANLRVIGLDAIHRFDGVVNPSTGEIVSSGLKKLTAEQEEWLIARLNETLPGSGDSAAGYSVVVCGHYPLDDFSETTNGKNRTWNDGWVCNTNQNGGIAYDHKTGDITNWHFTTIKSIDSDRKYCYRNRVGTTSSWSKGTVNNIGDIIQNFKNNGGKFVAFLCGHFHSDMMFYPKSYPDLLNIAVTQAGWLRGGGSENKENLNCTRLSANYIGIDTATGHIKIVRLGSKANKYLAPLHYICYDYINKKIVNEG